MTFKERWAAWKLWLLHPEGTSHVIQPEPAPSAPVRPVHLYGPDECLAMYAGAGDFYTRTLFPWYWRGILRPYMFRRFMWGENLEASFDECRQLGVNTISTFVNGAPGHPSFPPGYCNENALEDFFSLTAEEGFRVEAIVMSTDGPTDMWLKALRSTYEVAGSFPGTFVRWCWQPEKGLQGAVLNEMRLAYRPDGKTLGNYGYHLGISSILPVLHYVTTLAEHPGDRFFTTDTGCPIVREIEGLFSPNFIGRENRLFL